MLKADKEEQIKDLKEDLKKVKPLDTLARSEGGKILVDGLTADIVSNFETFTHGSESFTLDQFKALAVSTKEKLDLVRTITRAKDNKRFLEEELKEALKE